LKLKRNKISEVGEELYIKTDNGKINKKSKSKKNKKVHNNGVQSKLKSPVKDKSSPKKINSTSNIQDVEADISINITAKKRPKSDKLWRLKIRDHSKASNLVQQLVQPASDFVCLECSQGFQSFSYLRSHKLYCKETKVYQMYSGSKNPNNIKNEIVNDNSQELFEYVTGAVTKIPETTFNNMHGKITDLKTEDAQKFSSNPLNEIGLVKLNYSGTWSVKDVWESGGWEPRDDQLTWQQYELSSAISKHQQTERLSAESAKSEEEALQVAIPDEDFSGINIKKDLKSINTSQSFPSPTDLAHGLTRQLTTQIVSRKAPLITCESMDRKLVTKLARLPWSEQRKVKEKFDASLVAKRTKRISISGESLGNGVGHSPAIRQSGVTNRLELKQMGKSVKYMKAGDRETQAKEREEKNREEKSSVVQGKLAGEWEIEHSFLCSVCGIEYDDVLEILHHKWESHPHCLVTHVSLKEGVVRPPALLYPQVGPSTIHLDPNAPSPSSLPPLTCTKCNTQFPISSKESQGQFHLHLLDCGGVKDQEGGKRRKRKRRGHGGGLKSTVRMLQKGNHNGNSRDGTDTEEPTPKKRSRGIPKVTQLVPLVPTHSRTTRFKETKKKEARKLAAKDRRNKSKVQRPSRSHEDSKNVTVRRKIDMDKISSDKQTVAELLETVISKVEKAESRPGRSKRKERMQNDMIKRGRKNHRERRLSVVRARQMDLYREQSSESEEVEEEEEETETQSEKTPNIDKKINKRRGRQHFPDSDTKVSKAVSNITSENEVKTSLITKKPLNQTPTKPVSVKIENDDNLLFLMDLDRVAPYVESPIRDASPYKTPIRGLSPLKHYTGNASPVRLSEESSRSSSISSLIDLFVDSDSSEDHNDSGRNGLNGNIDDSSPKTASRSLKRLETNLVSKLLLPVSIDEDSKRRNSFQVSYRSKFQPTRFVFPIELKISAIARVESGETQAAVARDLNINTATLAAWWLRRSEIKIKFDREVMVENGGDIKSHTAIDMLVKKFKTKDDRGYPDKSLYNEQEIPSYNKVKVKIRNSSASLDNRTGLPLHVKAKALKQVLDGKTQAAIAKELSINPSTVAHWWAKKDVILQRYETNELSMEVAEETKIQLENKKTSEVDSLNSDRIHSSDGLLREKDVNEIEDEIPERRKSFDGRSFPREVKLRALKRLDAGATKASVSRELGIGVTTLGLWVRRRDSKQKISEVGLNNVIEKASEDLFNRDKKQVYSLELKVKAIGRIDSGEDVSSVADTINANVNTVAAWWNRREKIIKKSRMATLSISKVSTSLDDRTVQVTYEDKTNIKQDTISNSQQLNKTVNLDEKSEVFVKCLEIVSPLKSNVKETGIEKHNIRGRRLNLTNHIQHSPQPSGRLYMPLEVKQSAIRRIEEGTTQVVVARDLDMSLSTIASWWRKKDLILQNIENGQSKNLVLKDRTDKEYKTTVLNKEPNQDTIEHIDPIIEPTVNDVVQNNAEQEVKIQELKSITSIDTMQTNGFDEKQKQNIEHNDKMKCLTEKETTPKMHEVEKYDQNHILTSQYTLVQTEDPPLELTNDSNDLDNSEDQSILFSSMKSAFNGMDCDLLEVEAEQVLHANKQNAALESSNSEVVKSDNKDSSESNLIKSTEPINGEDESLSTLSKPIVDTKTDCTIENASESTTKHQNTSFDSRNKEDEEIIELKIDNVNPKLEINRKSEDESDPVKTVPQNTADSFSIVVFNSFSSKNGHLKDLHMQEIGLAETSCAEIINERDNEVIVLPTLDSKSKTEISLIVETDEEPVPIASPVTPNPIKSHSPPIAMQKDNHVVKGIKKKSLDFLANSLMKKALARSQSELAPFATKPSQSLSSSSDHCQIVQESHVLLKERNVQIAPSPPLTPQSGLGLIVSSYYSSEDEL